MKINFALIGLAAAQSGDDDTYDYGYDDSAASSERWESVHAVNHGVTFTQFDGKTSGQYTPDNFVRALKLSCWNSNMIRDMNNDNKFHKYTFTAGTPLDEIPDDHTLRAEGDLRTGMNHQYGFEHLDDTRTENLITTAKNDDTTTRDTEDADYSIHLPASGVDQYTKWGYQSDTMMRHESDGYSPNVVVYHFGHGDNMENLDNRPDKFSDTNGAGVGFPADFHGYKDDWRYSLRMGGCLYEATNWIYDADSFHRTGRLTYTGDRQFYRTPFDGGSDYPTTGSYFADVHWVHVFNAHIYPWHNTGYYSGAANPTNDSIERKQDHTSEFLTNNGVTPLLSKSARTLEDFNVVMANPTYEGHGFLNFVATYHDHVDAISHSGSHINWVGYRFTSTIRGQANDLSDPDADLNCETLRDSRIDLGGGSPDLDRTDVEEYYRCGAAIYENFGDWYFRPAQKYESKENDTPNSHDMNFWAYIMPINYDSALSTMWDFTSTFYDVASDGSPGFAISSFPHNELGKDFRFNIRTLHMMGGGVSKTERYMDLLQDSDKSTTLLTSSTFIWSYYFYAVDTIHIAFPEYVGRVNHCHTDTHRNDVHCTAPDFLGIQDIIIDGVTMKKFATPDNPYSQYDTRAGADTRQQYAREEIMGEDDETRATLLHYSTHFGGTLGDANHHQTYCNGATYQASDTDFNPNPSGLSELHQPVKPCASWCQIGVAGRQTCGRVLKIENLLRTYDELHLRQYGTIQEIWVQLMYAYVESFDPVTRPVALASAATGVESPFPNVFFSAPEVMGIKAECDNGANYKCRGYMSDEHQPYGGSRDEDQRVYGNYQAQRTAYENNADREFGAGENDYHSDSLYPVNNYREQLPSGK